MRGRRGLVVIVAVGLVGLVPAQAFGQAEADAEIRVAESLSAPGTGEPSVSPTVEAVLPADVARVLDRAPDPPGLKATPGTVVPGAESGVRDVDLPGLGVGGVVGVGRPGVKDVPAGGVVPDSVEVELLGASSAGLGDGVLAFRLAPADGKTPVGAAVTSVRVDYSKFAAAFGGDWASRLGLVKYPSCVLVRPDDPACQRYELVPVENDLGAGVLVATVGLADEVNPRLEFADLAAEPEPVTDPTVTPTLEGLEGQATGLSLESGLSGFVGQVGGSGGGVFALSAGTGSGGGDYAATSLAPSGKWQVALASGSFGWSYPVPVPPATVGGTPSVSLEYSSQAVDGMTSSENTQPGPEGLGWSLAAAGFVERSYVGCANDGGNASNQDQCWYKDSATLSLNGQSGELVYGGSGVGWKLTQDPGWQIKKGTSSGNGDDDGEYWEVTTTDGTRYLFGYGKAATNPTLTTSSVQTVPVTGNNSGEPCNTAPASTCTQAYRWNLDRIIDLDGNVTQFFYVSYTNKYNAFYTTADASYVRDAVLDKIEYSAVAGTSVQPAHQIDFQYANRCIQQVSDPAPACGGTAADWPDVPLDLECTSACTETSATFFTKKRLNVIQTRAFSGSWRTVDEVELNHSLSASSSTHVKLLLQEIIRHGYDSAGASAVLPTVMFNYIDLDSRPDAIDFTLFRLDEIFDELAGHTTVVYFRPDPCPANFPNFGAGETWGENPYNCFPAWTSHGDWGSGFGIYNKWLTQAVAHVDNFSNASPADFWQYEYGLTGATTTDEQYLWHHSDNALAPGSSQVFNDWRGYPQVTVTYGATGGFQKTEYRYYRGMHGDQGNLPSPRVVNVRDSDGTETPDSEWFAGQVRETRSLNSAGTTRLAKTVNTYLKVATSASQSGSLYINTTYTPSFAPREAWIVRQTETTAFPGSGSTHTISTTSYDTSYGLPIDQIAKGDPATGADDRCTTTTYHRNASIWLVDPVKDTTVYGNSTCTTPSFAKTEYLYDGQAGWGTPPPEGHVTKSRRYHTGSLYDETAYSQDGYGRPTAVTNPRDIATLTGYTPTTHALTTSTAVTKDWGGQGLVTTTTLDNRRSRPTQVTDPNSNITKVVYDHFGRLASAQLPTETVGGGVTKSVEYTYNLSATNNARPWVKTKTLVGTGPVFRESWTLLDSAGRTRQTQSAPAPGRTGAILTTTLYNARGLVDQASIPFGASSVTPGGTYQAVTGNYHKFTYDALDRPTSDTLWQSGPPDTALFGSLTSYGDLTTTVISPEGRRVVTTKNLFGETAEAKTQSVAGADYAITSTSYTPLGKPLLITHPDGTTTDYSYDLAGRVTSHDDPDRGLWTFAYDGNDNQTLMATNINSDAVCSGNDGLAMTYTSLDQPQNIYQDCGASGLNLKQYTYYTTAGLKGLLDESRSKLDWNSTAKVYKTKNVVYDPRGRVTQRTYTVPNPTGGTDLSYTYNYAYNQANQATSVIIPDPDGTGPLANETLNTTYDPGTGQALTLIGNTTYQTGATFSTDNLPTQRTLAPAGSMQVRRTYGYDTGTRRLTNIAANTDLTPGGSTQTLFSSILTYSNDGNITDLATSTTTSGVAVNQTQCFNYDDYNRLTHAWTRNNVSGGTCNHVLPPDPNPGPNPDGAGTDPYYQQFAYDLDLGKTNTLTSYTLGTTTNDDTLRDLDFEDTSSPHAVTDVNETTFYEINANGSRHRQNGEPTANSYHRTNQLKKLVDNVSLTTNEYAYDTGGLRIAQKITPNAGSSVTASTTIYLEGQELTWAGSATIPTVDRYYQIPGGPTLALRKQTNTIYWLFNDQQQTSTHALQQNQTIPTAQRYLPFGQTRGTNNVLPTQHGFLGKTEDDHTRTVHTDHREYDPTVMQFTSVDPMVAITHQAYAYAGNNPTTYADPTGLVRVLPDKGEACMDPACVVGYKPPLSAEKQAIVEAYVGAGGSSADPNDKAVAAYMSRSMIRPECLQPGSCIRKPGNFFVDAFRIFVFDRRQCSSRLGCGVEIAGVLPLGKIFKGIKWLGKLARGADNAHDAWRATDTAADVIRLGTKESWGNPSTLARHFRDHGADFAAKSADDYARQASEFLQQSGTLTKIDADGVIRVYDPATNTFGAYNPNGTTRTFFKPSSATYWDRQPGSPPAG